MKVFSSKAAVANGHMATLKAHVGDVAPIVPRIRQTTWHALPYFINRCGWSFVAKSLISGGHLNRAGEPGDDCGCAAADWGTMLRLIERSASLGSVKARSLMT
jgi:hypothetical protein